MKTHLVLCAAVLGSLFLCTPSNADWVKDGTAEVDPGSATMATENKYGSGTTTPDSSYLSVTADAAATLGPAGGHDAAVCYWTRSFTQKFKWEGGGSPTNSFSKSTTSTISGNWTMDDVYLLLNLDGYAVAESTANFWTDYINSSDDPSKKAYPVAPATGVSTGSIFPVIGSDPAKASKSFSVYAKAAVTTVSGDPDKFGKGGTAHSVATFSIAD